jgi:hypothetical protein
MKNKNLVKCPKCDTDIDVQDIISHQLEDEINQKYQAKVESNEKKYDKQLEDLQKKEQIFESAKKDQNKVFQDKLEEQVKAALKDIEAKVKSKLDVEQADQFKSMQKELNEQSEKLKDFNKSKAEIEKLKREKGELGEKAEAEAQIRLNKTLETERTKIAKTESDKNELRFKELQKQLEDQKDLTAQMKKKQEQGSMQLQGEVQELAIEEWLETKFPLDTIEEIKKGVRGADCLQIVNTREIQNCGTIYYESKRTQNFSPTWIEKFKNDIREKGANIGVLVTEVMPPDMDRMGMKDGVWICDFNEFKGLCAVLRESIIQIRNAISTQENKGDKMVMLYDFLTSNEFKLQIEGIVEGFTQMQADLEKEKRSIQGHWKKREKQINKVLLNTNHMYSSIKGIAGNAIQSIQALELDDDEELLE